MTTIQLEKLVKKLPHRSGIYIFKDSINKPLYIGKALDLKNRIKNYLKTDDVRLQKMIAMAKKLDFIQTNSDIEALILESRLIKKFRPRFNIVMRDDKQYAFVGFTAEKYPRIFVTHQPGKAVRSVGSVQNVGNDNNSIKRSDPTSETIHQLDQFVGPFTDVGALKITLRYLRRIFPYCTCTKLHNNFCLNYHIGKCLGFCCLKKHLWITDLRSRLSTAQGSTLKKSQGRTLNSYKKNITSIKMVLSGKKKSVIRNLEKEMVALGKKMEKFVPILFSTESKLQNRGSSISGKIEDFDEIGKKAIELRGKLKKLKRIFENAKIIQKSSHTHISIYGYEKKKNTNKKTKDNLVKTLGLPKTPVRIEGYDVSNIQGVHATGSMVTFVNGQPDKNYYRKFKIQTKKTSNDTAMLKEILERRFKHDEWPFPDLILIDGDKGQVNAARAAITNYQGSTLNLQKGRTLRTQKIPIIGISKNERHLGHQLIIPGRKTPLPLSKLSPADKNLLLQIDSEAHRFAVSYYRNLHRKNLKATF